MTFKRLIQCNCLINCVWPIYEQSHILRTLQLFHMPVPLGSCAATISCTVLITNHHVTCH